MKGSIEYNYTICFLLFIGLLICAKNGFTQTRLVLEPVGEPNVDWFDDIPLSGGVRVGIMTELSEKKVNPASLHVQIPESDYRFLCVDIISRDKRYVAEVQYEISPKTIGLANLKLPEEYRDKLRNYSESDVAILAQLNNDCKAKTQSFLISSWQSFESIESVTVFSNSESKVKILGTRDGLIEFEKNCEDLTGESRAFNRKCTIPREWLGNVELFLRLQLFPEPKDFALPISF